LFGQRHELNVVHVVGQTINSSLLTCGNQFDM